MASAFFDLVLKLRGAGLRLDVDGVKAVMAAISLGRGLENDEAFRSLCAAIWVRTEREKLIFDTVFDDCRPSRNNIVIPPPAPQPKGHETQDVTTPSVGNVQDERHAASVTGFNLRQTDLNLALPNEEMVGRQIIALQNREYLPITGNQTKQSWRYLRLMARSGPKTEVDLHRTLHNIADQGDLTEPVMVPRRSNQARLILLIDISASMVAFHELGRRLLKTAKGGHFRSVKALYFTNVIEDYLFHDFGLSEGVSFVEFCGRLDSAASYIMVFSDFGAARGYLDPRRVEQTIAVAKAFASQRLRVAWVNPVPTTRWTSTSAEEISRATRMFELSRRGLDLAIGYLRGVRTVDRVTPRVTSITV
jgi:uncharacterized protein with von Willebrand factor type A (vWA) domain